MKIGFSFGRCVRDIVLGKVDIEDVLMIVARTAIYDSTQISGVVNAYMNRQDYFYGLDQEKCNEVATELYLGGKIFQPRILGFYPKSITEDYVWMDVVPTLNDESQMSEQVAKAWRNYQMALKMTSENKMPEVPRSLF